MRIAGWHIEGFGIFQDFEVRLPEGLTVFVGPNEAGKSTLLGFLRAMLFGFPNRRGRALHYPPLRGGRHGGRLILSGPQGETVIERFAGRRNGLLLNGSEASQEDLHPLLGGADEGLFSSVFAFGLSEIQSFAWLEAEQIRERIFSAGIAGAGASARRVMDALGEEATAILRTRGVSKVRNLSEQIDQAERRLELARKEAERYTSLEDDEENWRRQAALLSDEEAELLRRQRALEASLELWTECERARKDLAGLEAIDHFPDNPEARLAELTTLGEAAQNSVRLIEGELSAKERLRDELMLDERLEIIGDGVEEMHGQLTRHLSRLETLSALRGRKGNRVVWLGLGVVLASAEVWLVGRNEIAAAVAGLLAALLGAGFLLYERAARGAKITWLEHEIAGWEDPVREWLGSAHSGERLTQEFLGLRERCRNSRDVRAKALRLDEAISEIKTRLESAKREIEPAEKALDSFLREAGAGNEAEFQTRLRVFRKRRDLLELIAEREARSGKASGAAGEWTVESSRVLELLRDVRSRRDEAVGAQRLAEAERRRIAESATIPTIQAELECLRTERAAAVREWRVLTLARELAGLTLQEFTATRQPAVLEEASAAFARITGGAYERVLQEEDRESLVVVDRQAQRKRLEELSRGTAEQLYLCVRLGLASEFARRSAWLPLVMDDVLVNFDPERARAVAGELARFSIERQILVFTCHPETARLFSEAKPGLILIHLPQQAESAAKN